MIVYAQAAATTDTGFGGFVARLAASLGLEESVLVQRALAVLIIVVAAWVTIRLARVLTRRVLHRFEGEGTLSERQQRARTLTELVHNATVVVVVLAALLTALNLFIPIGPLLAGVGVFGLAISFGAQSLVKDMITGFYMLLENQLTVGDSVEINGKKGEVERMTLRVVMLRDMDGNLHILPNGTIESVTNKTRGWSRVVLDVGVAYRERVDEVMRVCGDVLIKLWNDQTWRPQLTEEPQVLGVQDLADSAVNIRLLVKTQPGKQWNVRRELLRRLKNRFDEEGIEIPFPQRTLHVGTGQEVPVIVRSRDAPSRP